MSAAGRAGEAKKDTPMTTQDSYPERPLTWAEIAGLYKVTPRTISTWRKRDGLDDIKGRLLPKDLARIFETWGNPYSDFRKPPDDSNSGEGTK
jgi:hypothetical protein